jgi:carbonic anhydrase
MAQYTNRRGMLKSAAGLLTISATQGRSSGATETFRAPGSPAEALNLLSEGNQRFREKRLLSLEDDLKILRTNTVDEQKPFAAVLSCADSRVPVELVFDQTIGHLFVVRVAGNLATPATIASLEYGAIVLGVKVLVVVGHRNCGAVKATIGAKAVPGQISSLYQYILPGLKAGGVDPDLASRENAKYQANLLLASSPEMASLVKDRKLAIKASYYDVATGKVEFLEG